MGRKPLMIVSGLLFVFSIPVIALSHGYSPLFFGRLLQGISGGLIGIVVPLYLAECLKASTRGKGTGVFQWLLTLGVVSAALIGIYYSYRVAAVERVASPAAIFAFKNQAWRRIFWVSLPPGLVFVLGSFFLAESPRWLFKRGKKELAYAALLRSRTKEEADVELSEMEETALAAHAHVTSGVGAQVKDSLLRRKYVIPFLLACGILLMNQATGINSLIAYNTGILLQSGLSDVSAHWGYVIFTCVNFLVTIVGMTLVDKKGRKFLFTLGTSGIIVSMVGVGLLFIHTERANIDCRNAIQAMVQPDQTLTLPFDATVAKKLLAAEDYSGNRIEPDRASLEVI
ncbi:MAG TPA: MFS transporter, partial [Acidobacteriaceae bacterium]|nr:MFS transporter [Acidobacteriaceae bacterium]